ncbi:MAG: lipocalin-like domain-containing protein [Pseudomonadota bacterium]
MTQRFFRGRRVAILLTALTGAAISMTISPVAFATGLAEKLVGTWRIVRFVDTDAHGKVTYLFGEHPSGYIVYDPTGHLIG